MSGRARGPFLTTVGCSDTFIITLKYSNIEIGCVGIEVFVIIAAVGIRTFIGPGNIQYTTLKCAVTLCVFVLEKERLL